MGVGLFAAEEGARDKGGRLRSRVPGIISTAFAFRTRPSLTKLPTLRTGPNFIQLFVIRIELVNFPNFFFNMVKFGNYG